MEIRRAEEKDVSMLFEWVNSQEVRDNAFSKQKISFFEHENWLTSKLSSDTTYIYIGSVEERPVGQVRFELKDDKKVFSVDIHVSPGSAGKGYGTELLRGSISKLKSMVRSNCLIEAIVFASNLPSQNCFLKNGFKLDSTVSINDVECHRYLLNA